jgi:hypothetical protein
MASNINDTGVNSDYPVAGQDNDSQGFRDNFGVIKSNFVSAKSEIESLQNTTAQGVSYNASTSTNDFLNSNLQSANFVNCTEQHFSLPNAITTTQTVNVSSGSYQSFRVGADITLKLSSWNEDDNKTGKIRLYITNDGAEQTITFSSNEGAGDILRSPNWPTSDNTAVIENNGESNDPKNTYVFEFVSFDSGATVYAEYLGIYK